MMSARTSLTSTSSPTYGGPGSVEPTDKILHMIREAVFDVDLFQLLESNISTYHGIIEMLKKMDVLNISSEVADVVIELGLILNQIY